MRERGVSVRAIAERADVSHSHLSRALRPGTAKTASPELIAAVAVALDLPEDYFPEVRHARVTAALRQRPDALNRLYDGLSQAGGDSRIEDSAGDAGRWVLAASFARAASGSDRDTRAVLADLRSLPGVSADAQALSLQETLLAAAADFARRALSPREHRRASATWVACITEVHLGLERGHALRTDGFLARRGDGDEAALLLEEVLVAGAAELDGDKLVRLGHLFAWAVLDSTVSAATARDFVALTRRLSAQALLLLELLAGATPLADWETVAVPDPAQQALLRDVLALVREGLVHSTDGRERRSVREVDPARLTLTASAGDLRAALGLAAMRPRELERVRAELAGRGSGRAIAPRRRSLQTSTEPVTVDDLARAELRVKIHDVEHAVLPAIDGEIVAVVRGFRMRLLSAVDWDTGEQTLRIDRPHIDELRDTVRPGDRLHVVASEDDILWME